MALTDAFTRGMFLMYEDKIHLVLDRKYKTQGRQGGLLILTMQNLDTLNNITVTIKAGVKLEQIEPAYKEMQYSYNDGDFFYFLDSVSYEMVPLSAKLVDDYSSYLKEGESYVIMFYDDNAISMRRNPTVELLVVEAEPAVKGNTANTATKLVTTETGLRVAVPLFIDKGDKIVVNTESGTYTKRA